jgi:hypothetical protein
MTIFAFKFKYAMLISVEPSDGKGMQLTHTVAEVEFRKKLNRMDCGSIAVKLMKPDDKVGWTLEQTTAAIEDYRRFLLLNYLYPDRIIVPSQIVDRVWHEHILDTEKYQADCLEIFGYFLHHYPFFGMVDEVDKQDSEVAFADTCQLWERHFG